MHWFLFIALWTALGFSMIEIVPLDYFYYIWIPMGVAFFIWGVNIEKRKTKQKLEEENKIKNEENKKKQSLLEQYGLPIDCKKFRHEGGYDKFPNGRWLYVWREGEYLSLLSNQETIEKYQILLTDINFYSAKGDVRQETETKGGNATMGETMVAEGLLGTAAAMKKNQAVQNIKTIDERKTIINVTIDAKNSFIFFEGADLYKYLLEQIPEKEQSFVAMNKQNN